MSETLRRILPVLVVLAAIGGVWIGVLAFAAIS